jgi:hypothetical protein
MQYHFQVSKVKNVSGKSDQSKKYAVLSGLVTLANGEQEYVEFFQTGASSIQPGFYVIELEFEVSFEHKPGVRIKSLQPVRPVAKAA